MAVRILRNELRNDRNGNPEIFVNVEVTDDSGLYTRAEWLTAADVTKVLADPTAVNAVAAEIAARAAAARKK